MSRLRREVVKVNKLFIPLVSPPNPCAPRKATLTPTYPVRPISLKLSLPPQNLVRIQIESIFEGQDLSVALGFDTWQTFHRMALSDIAQKTSTVLNNSGSSMDQVDHVLVTGSSTRLPEVIQLVEETFKGRLEVPTTVDPVLAGVQGAGIRARRIELHSECPCE